MNLSFSHDVDLANKLLIFAASGQVSNINDIEYLMKSIIKLAGKNKMTNVIHDVTKLQMLCSSMDISSTLMHLQEVNLLGDIRIARIVKEGEFKQTLVGDLAQKLSLPIRNFYTRSDAMLWLLFNLDKK